MAGHWREAHAPPAPRKPASRNSRRLRSLSDIRIHKVALCLSASASLPGEHPPERTISSWGNYRSESGESNLGRCPQTVTRADMTNCRAHCFHQHTRMNLHFRTSSPIRSLVLDGCSTELRPCPLFPGPCPLKPALVCFHQHTRMNLHFAPFPASDVRSSTDVIRHFGPAPCPPTPKICSCLFSSIYPDEPSFYLFSWHQKLTSRRLTLVHEPHVLFHVSHFCQLKPAFEPGSIPGLWTRTCSIWPVEVWGRGVEERDSRRVA